jgi:hypothetical protein
MKRRSRRATAGERTGLLGEKKNEVAGPIDFVFPGFVGRYREAAAASNVSSRFDVCVGVCEVGRSLVPDQVTGEGWLPQGCRGAQAELKRGISGWAVNPGWLGAEHSVGHCQLSLQGWADASFWRAFPFQRSSSTSEEEMRVLKGAES